MPWCPKCKSEYREGFTVCSDCGTELVEELTGTENVMEEKELEISAVSEEEAEYYNSGSSSNKKSLKHSDSADKANENRSSAWMLIIFGIVGLVVVVLGILGLLPFNIGNPYLFYGVMGGMFLIFLIAGFISMKNAKYFDQKAESENTLKKTLLEWCKENLDAEEIDARVAASEVADEVLYFRRFAYIKQKINYQFVNLDQEFVDGLIDDVIYDSVFEK